MGVSAQEWQVVDDGDVYEVFGLLYDPGDGFKVVAAVFGDEDVRRGLSLNTEQLISFVHSVNLLSSFNWRQAALLLLSHAHNHPADVKIGH